MNYLLFKSLPILKKKQKDKLMIEHWFEYLPAAWFTPEGRWYVILCVLLLMVFAFSIGFLLGKRK